MRLMTKVICACGRRLWWVDRWDGRGTVRAWVPPTGRETEPDLEEACTPGVAVPRTCPEHRAADKEVAHG
jgi:hypothetical protein